MVKYNKEKAIVYNTLQLYRWDRLEALKNFHKTAEEKGYHMGVKLVRGAYMEKERERATHKNYKSLCVLGTICAAISALGFPDKAMEMFNAHKDTLHQDTTNLWVANRFLLEFK